MPFAFARATTLRALSCAVSLHMYVHMPTPVGTYRPCAASGLTAFLPLWVACFGCVRTAVAARAAGGVVRVLAPRSTSASGRSANATVAAVASDGTGRGEGDAPGSATVGTARTASANV